MGCGKMETPRRKTLIVTDKKPIPSRVAMETLGSIAVGITDLYPRWRGDISFRRP